MRRSRVKRNQPSLSLFPFLAVLICTMGILIVLLVIVTQEAKVQAEQRADEVSVDQSEKINELKQIQEREELRATLLEDLRPDLQQRLQAERLRRSHLEEQIRELRNEAENVANQLELLNEGSSSSSISSLQADAARLENEIATARLALEDAREQIQTIQRSYAVIPYPGPNGTTRRPIYLECTTAGIRLQPHGVLIKPEDLSEPVLAGNPLDAALLAIRQYQQKYTATSDEPYPLIIVRPGGAESYALVRRAMKSWDDEFGYELVGADVQLEFPGEDARLAAHVHEVVERAKVSNAQLQAAMIMQQRAQQLRANANSNAYASGSQELLANGGQGTRRGIGNGNGGSSESTSRGFGSGDDGGQGSGGQSDVVLRATQRRGGFTIERNGNGNSESEVGFGTGTGAFSDTQRNPTQYSGSQSGDRASESSQLASNTRSGDATSQLRNPNGQSGNAGQASGQSSRSGSSGDSQQSMIGNSAAASSPFGSIAEQRGSDWALPSKSPDATAYRRPIQVYCNDSQLVVDPGAYSRVQVREIELTGSTDRHLDEMVDAVWRLIDSWGFAGYNAYWKPEIHVTVDEGGEQRFRDLQALMRGSGIEVRRKAQ